ncbi:MAG: ABC transporter substrate-binding protein [Chloroflexi bacterium]|nr:MAG: ABC transporter substrate-binding protein [Chloroflexota bacterium]
MSSLEPQGGRSVMGERTCGSWRRPAIAAAGALLAVACGGGAATTGGQPATGSPIRIGVIDDNGTSSAIEGAELRVNTDLAVNQANASGGIKGHPLQTVYMDPQGDAAKAVAMAQELVQQQNVDVLVGGIFSPECLGIQNLAPRLQTVYLPSTGPSVLSSEGSSFASCARNARWYWTSNALSLG